MNFGVALPTASGRRYLLSGILPTALSPFLLGELRQIPGVKGAYNSVLDGNGVFIATTNPRRPAGYKLHTAAQLTCSDDPVGCDHGPLLRPRGIAEHQLEDLPLGS